MKLTLASCLLCTFVLAGPAMAQTTAPSGAMKMSQSECDAAWQKLDSATTGSVAQAKAEPMLSDFKKADINNDGNLSRTEFQTACDTGLVKGSASMGTGSGTSDTMKK